MRFRTMIGAIALAAASCVAQAQQYTVRDFVDYPKYESARISPDGRFLAVTVPEAHTTRLVVIDLGSRKVTLSTGFGSDIHVNRVWWVSPTRMVFDTVQKFGSIDTRVINGDLFAINYDGTAKATLWGPRVNDGTYGEVLNTLPDDDDHIIIAAYGLGTEANPPAPTAWRIDVNDNREDRKSLAETKRIKLVTAPAGSSQLYADPDGQIRGAAGRDAKTGLPQLFYRAKDSRDWVDISRFTADDEEASIEGFNRSTGHPVIDSLGSEGMSALFDLDPVTGARQQLAGRKDVDIDRAIYALDDSGEIAGVRYELDYPTREFFRKDDLIAQIYQVVGAAFPGHQVSVTSMTRDHKRAVIQVWDDKNPSDYYLLDVPAKKVEYMFSRYPSLEPDDMGTQEHVAFKSRDGLTIHGYLTLPKGKRTNLPLIVLPHGGPHFVRDYYGYNEEAQLFANHGYAVFQVNYRGSGGYGRPFVEAGYLHWGTTMQDDLTDATLWAVQQGIADKSRLCIYGASYGGYAALMGAVREPDLYKCTVGYVGVYDITVEMESSDSIKHASGRRYLAKFHGTDENEMRRRSAAYNAEKIKADVMLIAGGMDRRVPPKNYDEMRAALDKVGKKYETLYQPLEGHGFRDVDHNVELYTKMLNFFQKNIGGPDTLAPLPDNKPKGP